MKNQHMTIEGEVPFTEQEEVDKKANEAQELAGLPMRIWKKDMRISDGSLMPRYLEDLITDKFAGDAGTSLQERYLAKIKIRGERP